MNLTEQELKIAREWIADCQWNDIDGEDDIDQLTPTEIARGIHKNYEGGIAGFKRSCIEG
jgi:hypothetical protein